MKFKKLLFIFSMFILFFNLKNVFANNTNAQNINDLCYKYNLRDIDIADLPEGINPIVINSYGELEKFISNIEKSKLEIEKYKLNDKSYVRAKIPGSLPLLKPWLELYCYYEYNSEKIERYTDKGWDLYGSTAGISIGSQHSNATITNGKLNVSGLVSIDYYIIIDGIIKAWTTRFEAGYDYDLNKGYFNDYLRAIYLMLYLILKVQL